MAHGMALFGSESRMSAMVLKRLIARKASVRAVVFFPKPTAGLRVEMAGSVAALASRAGIPVFRIGDWADGSLLRRILDTGAGLFLCACFPHRMPAVWYNAAPIGTLNLHPSRLPGYRGPTPLFWQFRDGLSEFGISLHALDEGLDTGPILAVDSLAVAPGERGPHTLQRLSNRGADLVMDWLARPAAQRFQQLRTGAQAGYGGWPRAADYRLNAAWPAQRLYRFVAGVAAPGVHFEISWGERLYDVCDVASPPEDGGTPGFRDGLLTVRCCPGMLGLKARER